MKVRAHARDRHPARSQSRRPDLARRTVRCPTDGRSRVYFRPPRLERRHPTLTVSPPPRDFFLLQLLDIVHPAAKSLVDIARSQDSEVGDGTTTVVILAGEFLRECKPFVEDGVHPQNIIKSFREAARMAVARVRELAVSIEGKDAAEKRSS